MIGNQDLVHIGEYKIQLLATSGRSYGYEFQPNKESAKRRSKILQRCGYSVVIYRIKEKGVLEALT